MIIVSTSVAGGQSSGRNTSRYQEMTRYDESRGGHFWMIFFKFCTIETVQIFSAKKSSKPWLFYAFHCYHSQFLFTILRIRIYRAGVLPGRSGKS